MQALVDAQTETMMMQQTEMAELRRASLDQRAALEILAQCSGKTTRLEAQLRDCADRLGKLENMISSGLLPGGVSAKSEQPGGSAPAPAGHAREFSAAARVAALLAAGAATQQDGGRFAQYPW